MTVLANGRIYTMDDEATVAEAIVVREGAWRSSGASST